jgi:hypothetical protein
VAVLASVAEHPMDDITTAARDQTDEDILTYTVSDEAVEAAAGTEVRAGRCTGMSWLICTSNRPDNDRW